MGTSTASLNSRSHSQVCTATSLLVPVPSLIPKPMREPRLERGIVLPLSVVIIILCFGRTRLSLCTIWKSIILHDIPTLERECTKLGVKGICTDNSEFVFDQLEGYIHPKG